MSVRDPVAFRLKLLTGAGRNAGSAPTAVGGAHRQAEVVRRVAGRAGWGSTPPPNSGLGIASSFGQERDMPTWVACVARVRVDRATGAVSVERLTIVVDAGTVVDPDSARAQIEGSALWGLSMALHEGTEFVNGQVKDTNLDSYMPLRIADVPELDISFVDSAQAACRPGRTGDHRRRSGDRKCRYLFGCRVRLRHIPITPNALKAKITANK